MLADHPGIVAALNRTLRTTHPIENLNASITHIARNVKCWKDAQMTLHWVAGSLSDTRDRFRKLRWHRERKTLLAALTDKNIEAHRTE